MTKSTRNHQLFLRSGGLAALVLLSACAGDTPEVADAPAEVPPVNLATATLPQPELLMTVSGFEDPEAVFYDADQDIWFVSSFTGNAGDRDANGTVSRVSGETGEILELDWAQAADEMPFHAGRGMSLQGDTLWVADLDGVHGFHRVTGEQLIFVDLSANEPGFLNDVAFDGTGAVWVTDTGGAKMIQVLPESGMEIDTSDPVGSPNGILYDAEANALWLAPWSNESDIHVWSFELGGFVVGATSPGASRIDGLVHWGPYILAAVQNDTSIHIIPRSAASGEGRTWFSLEGRPADIGIDAGRNRIGIPYIAAGAFEIWQLPSPDEIR